MNFRGKTTGRGTTLQGWSESQTSLLEGQCSSGRTAFFRFWKSQGHLSQVLSRLSSCELDQFTINVTNCISNASMSGKNTGLKRPFLSPKQRTMGAGSVGSLWVSAAGGVPHFAVRPAGSQGSRDSILLTAAPSAPTRPRGASGQDLAMTGKFLPPTKE